MNLKVFFVLATLLVISTKSVGFANEDEVSRRIGQYKIFYREKSLKISVLCSATYLSKLKIKKSGRTLLLYPRSTFPLVRSLSAKPVDGTVKISPDIDTVLVGKDKVLIWPLEKVVEVHDDIR